MHKTASFFMALAACLLLQPLRAQVIIHSHNDYQQFSPLYEAFNHGVGSIEVDVFLHQGRIVVCHDPEQAPTAPTMEELYIKPLVELQKRGHSLKFMMPIDLKSSAETTLDPLVELLERYPSIFNPDNVVAVITGSRPDPSRMVVYPDFVLFDGRPDEAYTPEQLAKIALVSEAIGRYTAWNGKGSIPPAELDSIRGVIDRVHALGKKIRFWGTKDNPNTWLTLAALGVDVINTDRIAECANFFGPNGIKRYTLDQPLATYQPTYESDGRVGRPKNIIWIIGDGMSTTQITAAETANRGVLTLLRLLNIGFQKTSSANSYNTDSAGAGSALATGKKTNNRYISLLPSGDTATSISEVLYGRGKRIGVISSGDITDATPAAFYAHSRERNHSEEIAANLTRGMVSVLAGDNAAAFAKRSDGRNLFEELDALGYGVTRNWDVVDILPQRVVCIDPRFGSWATPQTVDYLAEVTRGAIQRLENECGFFLLVESAKIDHAGHANSLEGSVLETLLLDAAVAEALRFADRDGETLVIVTGDHETGGLVLLDGDRTRGSVTGYYVSDDHTGVLLPVFSYGVGAAEFKGVYENTGFFERIDRLTR